jgi:serine/threonine protein kinase
MIYCPECGSEVAPNDAFCPYCGISMATNPAHLSEELSHSDTSDSVEPEGFIAKHQDDLADTIPPLPLALDEDFQPPVAHLEEMKEPFVEEARAETSEAQLSQEKSEFIEASTPVLENEKNFQSSQREFTEPVPFIPIESEKFTSAPSTKNESENQEKIKTKEKVEIPRVETEESPLEIEPHSLPVAETLEAPISEIVGEQPVLTPTNEVDEFSATLPYFAADFADNKFDIGEFSIKQPEASQMVEKIQPVEENPVPKTEIPNAPEISSPAFDNPLAKDTAAIFKELPVGENSESVLGSEQKIENLTESAPRVEEPFKFEASPVAPETLAEPVVKETPIAKIPIEENSEPAFEPISKSEEFEKNAEYKAPSNPEIAVPLSVTNEPVVSEPGVSQVEPEVANDNQTGRAFTNPNIGVGVDTDGRSKTKLKPLDEGTILYGRYEIERKIGGGGMGAVYLAKDNNLGGVRRAVKEMVQSYIEEAQQDKAISDFKRESMLLTSLDHPAIPTIFDYFFDEKEGRFYLVMKYISGGDLAGRLRAAPEGRIDEVTVTDWAIQIADVLDYLHKHEPPIIYRDLKPSNIMIDGNTGKIMLIDFGIARTVHKEEKGVTAVGTMGYAPPELFSGNVEPSSDIYSLGSTLFHLLTGADPQSNPLLIFDFNKNPRPRQINPQLSDQIEQILMRSVEYSSGQRFASAAEMRDTLIKHMENLRKGSVTFGVMSANAGLQPASNIAVFCGFCGQKIVATDMFCPFCGAQQPLAGQSSQSLQSAAPVFASPKLTARLMIVGTNELEQMEYSLEKDNNLLGRRDPMSNIFPEVDLSKYDPQTKISRKHARIWRENDMFMLEDLGSSNGTILMRSTNESNRLLPRQPHVLTNGDKIRVGDTTLRFTIG